MAKKITFVKTVVTKWTLDVDAERERINDAFADNVPVRDRQLAIIDKIDARNIDGALKLIEALGSDEEGGCHEAEYVGEWSWPFGGGGCGYPSSHEFISNEITIASTN